MSGLSNYTELQTAIGDWLKDASLAAQTGVFIALVEAYLNRELRVPEMETFVTITSDNGTVDLPGDFLEMKYLWSGNRPPLSLLSIGELQAQFGTVNDAYARSYAIVGPTLYLGPTLGDDTDFRMAYWQKIPSLSEDIPTNWLIASNPDIYLYGALLMAEARGWNDERVPMFQSVFDGAIESLKMAGIKKRYGAGPLTMQAPVGDFSRRARYFGSSGSLYDYLVDG